MGGEEDGGGGGGGGGKSGGRGGVRSRCFPFRELPGSASHERDEVGSSARGRELRLETLL